MLFAGQTEGRIDRIIDRQKKRQTEGNTEKRISNRKYRQRKDRLGNTEH